jgi:hypothetical protein
MRTKPLWCAVWRDAFTETCDSGEPSATSRVTAVVVQHFANGEIPPRNQSRTICRFKTLPLDRQLRCICAATVQEVEVNSYLRVRASVDAGQFGWKRIDMRDRRSALTP